MRAAVAAQRDDHEAGRAAGRRRATGPDVRRSDDVQERSGVAGRRARTRLRQRSAQRDVDAVALRRALNDIRRRGRGRGAPAACRCGWRRSVRARRASRTRRAPGARAARAWSRAKQRAGPPGARLDDRHVAACDERGRHVAVVRSRGDHVRAHDVRAGRVGRPAERVDLWSASIMARLVMRREGCLVVGVCRDGEASRTVSPGHVAPSGRSAVRRGAR